jgi:Uma2 family endonuclease
MSLPGPRFTYDDYKLLPEDRCYEVIEGELLVTPAPNIIHQRISRRLFVRLVAFVESQGAGEVLAAPTDVILSEHNVVQPDILFVARNRLEIMDPVGGVRGAPDLVIEILSPGTASRDQVVKRKLYAKYGVREYWVVDPAARAVEILAEAPEGLETRRVFAGAAILTSPLLPGFEFPVADIFEG